MYKTYQNVVKTVFLLFSSDFCLFAFLAGTATTIATGLTLGKKLIYKLIVLFGDK